MSRSHGRRANQLRPVTITRGFIRHAEGSCLIACGATQVICTATVEESQPRWMRQQHPDRGWITAEYGMLPRATSERTAREATRGKQSGRTLEIQRLIGRSLRAVADLDKLGRRTIWIDCDVIQADGGTRTASITGAFVALMDACRTLSEQNKIKELPIMDSVAAVSCGLLDGTPMLDLDYQEDSACDTDMNFVMTGKGGFVEIQGTAEGGPFNRTEFDAMATLAEEGIRQLIGIQNKAFLKAAAGGE
ncbi:MAG: ribonuclease PH [Magnetococcales bacterium]|nr:ribonuclease PH [Magnetococcales bacterium]